jgi:predicted RNase H-like HicB family nuclease
MIRIIVALLVVAGLALGIWLLWPDGDTASNTATTLAASPTTTTTIEDAATTTRPGETTEPSVADSHVVETVEEAEEILRELWFGWFEGIYNQDEDRIREVVANPDQIQAALDEFDQMVFSTTPTAEAVVLTATDILYAEEGCLAVWASMDASSLTGGQLAGVHTFRMLEGRWMFLSLWANMTDLWESDCDVQL